MKMIGHIKFGVNLYHWLLVLMMIKFLILFNILWLRVQKTQKHISLMLRSPIFSSSLALRQLCKSFYVFVPGI